MALNEQNDLATATEPGLKNQPNGNAGNGVNPTNADNSITNADTDVINAETNNPVTNTAKEISSGIDENDLDEEADLDDDDMDDDDMDEDDMDEDELDEEDLDEEDNNYRDAMNDDSLKAPNNAKE